MDMLSAGLHAMNILLALGLLYVYLQNYRKLKSNYTLGLIVFVALFLFQSAMGLYFDASMVMYSSAEAKSAALILEAIKAASLAVLLKISWE